MSGKLKGNMLGCSAYYMQRLVCLCIKEDEKHIGGSAITQFERDETVPLRDINCFYRIYYP